MTVGDVNVDGKRCRVAAEAHRSDSRLVDGGRQPCLHRGNGFHRMRRPDRPKERALGEAKRKVGAATDSDTDDHRRTGPRSGLSQMFDDHGFGSREPFVWGKHVQPAGILASSALREIADQHVISASEFPIDDRDVPSDVVPPIPSSQGVNGVRSQGDLPCCLCDGLADGAAKDGQVRAPGSSIDEEGRRARVLTEREAESVGTVDVGEDRRQLSACDLVLFMRPCLRQRGGHVRGQAHAGSFDRFNQRAYQQGLIQGRRAHIDIDSCRLDRSSPVRSVLRPRLKDAREAD